MSQQQQPVRTVSEDSTDGIRKRVCKACDRCRLKKSKCDGAHPCSRCKADNAICVFGERKKSHDKIYPKGYVEMLEQQQSQLVSGLQEMYKRLQDASAWDGDALSEANGHPLTHDILASLDLLEAKADGSGDIEAFEEDCQKLQNRLLSEGAGYVQRRGSFSSDSDNSQRDNRSRPISRTVSQSSPSMVQSPIFRDSFSFVGSPVTSPTVKSPSAFKPTHRHSQSFAVQSPAPMHLPQAHPLLTQAVHHGHAQLSNDPQLYQPDWMLPDMSTPEQVMRAKFAVQPHQVMAHHTPTHMAPHLGVHRPMVHHTLSHPHLQQHVHQQAAQSHQHLHHSHALNTSSRPALFDPTNFDTPMPTAFVDTFQDQPMQMGAFNTGLMPNAAIDFGMDPMDMEFNKFISVTT